MNNTLFCLSYLFCDTVDPYMRQSNLFTKTSKTAPADEVAVNAKLLAQGGFIQKVLAGVYTFLPLGLRVMEKIEDVVRREMNAIGAQEILMPALHPRENWQTTGRWDEVDVLFKVPSRHGGEYALGPTHEEIVVPGAAHFLSSYKDLPFAVYQIQTKFRDEARAKSGLLRGREFRMKDLYSFHGDSEDLLRYYDQATAAYGRIFARLSLDALKVEASGGSFSKYSHEYQVIHPSGEDIVYHCTSCSFARNREIVDADLAALAPGATATCPDCSGKLLVSSGIEVGNTFQLNTKFSEPFNLRYKDASGNEQIVFMGCYGIGISRLMGVMAEVFSDSRGLIWPESVAPFQVHLLDLGATAAADAAYDALVQAGITVLYDDRSLAAGEKLATADLLGMPYRAIVSAKTGDRIELKKRTVEDVALLPVADIISRLRS